MSKDTIKISGIKAFGFHGVFEEERKSGQDFIADIEFTYKTEKAIKVCLNRFDDETKTTFIELYDKIDAEFKQTETQEVG